MGGRADKKAERGSHGPHKLLAAFGALARHGEPSQGREVNRGNLRLDAAIFAKTGR